MTCEPCRDGCSCQMPAPTISDLNKALTESLGPTANTQPPTK